MATHLSAESVAHLVEIGKRKNPLLSARYERAGLIVLNGEYQTTSDPDTVIVHGYHVNGSCECPDARYGAPLVNGERYCKHRIAKALLEKLAEQSTPAPQPEPAEHGNPGMQSMAWVSFAQSFKR